MSNSEEIEVELDGRVVERSRDLAWAFEDTPDKIIEQCCRFGLRNYEEALDLDSGVN